MQPASFQSQMLLDEPDVRVNLLRFAAGHQMPEHSSPKPIAIQVLSGEGEFETRGQRYVLERGTYLSLPSSEPHSVRALSALELLLTVHKSGGANAPSRVIRPNEVGMGQAHPLEILLECHRRNEQFVKVLDLLVQQPSGSVLERHEKSALELALRFFEETRPLHHRDEEESLFPRLAGSYLAPQLEKLAQEHVQLDKLHLQLQCQLQNWIAQGRLDPEERTAMSNLLRELAAVLKQHRRLEEEEVFPFAKKSFPAEVWSKIDQEFVARRK